MGIYDRDYYRQGRSGFQLRAPRTAIGAIIVVNVAIFLLELVSPLTPTRYPFVADFFSNHVVASALEQDNSWREVTTWWEQDTLRHPWLWWQWLTCGFVHDWKSPQHIVFNMLGLFFLGPDVEQRYGTREFIRLYLVTLVFSSVVWAVATELFERQLLSTSFGASGAIAGVITLFALNFPHRTLLFMMVIPMPAWLVGVILIGFDIYGEIHRGDNIAYAAHLGGAAFALAYFRFGWNFSRLTQWLSQMKIRSRPALKVYKPTDELHTPLDEAEVDRILEKIHREGENSLTRKERNILESASRKAQQRRRRPE